VAPRSEEVGERRGWGPARRLGGNSPRPTGAAGARRGRSGVTAADRQALATAWGGMGREPASDTWAPATVRAAGSAPFE
jgi:hypothetical protein